MVTGDLLSASSLLVAVITVVYSTWYAETTQALETPVALKRLDRDQSLAKVRRVLWTRAGPVAVAALALVGVLTPPAFNVARRSIEHASIHSYDPVDASFLLVWVVAVGLSAAAIQGWWRVLGHSRTLAGPDLIS